MRDELLEIYGKPPVQGQELKLQVQNEWKLEGEEYPILRYSSHACHFYSPFGILIEDAPVNL